MLIMSKRNYLLGNNENSGSQKTNHNPPQQDKTLREEIQCLGVQFKESQERMAGLLGSFLNDLRSDLIGTPVMRFEPYQGKHEVSESAPVKKEPETAQEVYRIAPYGDYVILKKADTKQPESKASTPSTASAPKKEEGNTYLKIIYFSKSKSGEIEWRQPLYNKRVALAVDPDAVGIYCIVDKDGYFVRQARPDEIKGVYIE